MTDIYLNKDSVNCWSVYVHTNIENGKRYVGITSRPVEKRWKNGTGYKDTVFGNAIKKYGWDGFLHEVLATGLSEAEAKSEEVRLIKEFNTMDRQFGYNRTAGGDGTPGMIHTDETREQMSRSHTGTFHSEETKRKISNSNTGNTKWLGKKHKEETKKKMSDSLTKYYRENPVTEQEAKRRSERAEAAYENDSTLRHRLSEKRKKYFEERPEARQKLSEKKREMYQNNPELKNKISERQSKPVNMLTADRKVIRSFKSLTIAMDETGVDRSSIARACNGKQRQAGGYLWEYVKNECNLS